MYHWFVRIWRMRCPTELQAGACWTGSYPAVLHDTSCANKTPGWRSPHGAVLPAPPRHRLLASLGRFATFLRLISAVSFRGLQSQSPPAPKCPLIPRGHLLMCPQRRASLFILISSRRFLPDAYNTTAGALDIPINLRRWLALACVRAPPAGVVCLHSTFQFHGVS